MASMPPSPSHLWIHLVLAVAIAMFSDQLGAIYGISHQARVSTSIWFISAIMLAILYFIKEFHDGFYHWIDLATGDLREIRDTQEAIYQHHMTSTWVLQPVEDAAAVSDGPGIDPPSTEIST